MMHKTLLSIMLAASRRVATTGNICGVIYDANTTVDGLWEAMTPASQRCLRRMTEAIGQYYRVCPGGDRPIPAPLKAEREMRRSS